MTMTRIFIVTLTIERSIILYVLCVYTGIQEDLDDIWATSHKDLNQNDNHAEDLWCHLCLMKTA